MPELRTGYDNTNMPAPEWEKLQAAIADRRGIADPSTVTVQDVRQEEADHLNSLYDGVDERKVNKERPKKSIDMMKP